MQKRSLGLILLLLIFTVNFAHAGTKYIFPAEDPVFSIVFPDDWKIEPDENILHATPADESIYLGVWALDAEDIDAALDALDELTAEIVADLKVISTDTLVVNDIDILLVEAQGVDEKGLIINVSAFFFSPDDETIFITLSYGTPEAEKAHQKELISILKSISAE
ncbi:hypothetical protein B6D60_03295 [candidate division KSB1 bacterium 4484_87]|nr:MAG: hypothetical protein B6D60_03295 [candidate division KSB1 bacterium 4484_87]